MPKTNNLLRRQDNMAAPSLLVMPILKSLGAMPLYPLCRRRGFSGYCGQ